MANQSRRLKRVIRKAIKKNPPAPEPRAALANLSELRARRDHVREELDRLQKLKSHTRYQHKQLLRFNSELERLNEVLGTE
jgi:hypothetical protein